jgi:predicted RNase H-like HicB family nuclease
VLGEIAMKYKVAIHEDEDGFAVSVPGLPEALKNIEAAIREYLEVVDDLIGDSTVREIEVAV